MGPLSLAKNEFYWKKRLFQFLNILIILPSCKKSEKTNGKESWDILLPLGCQLSMLLYITVAEVLAIFIDVEYKIGDHEIEIVNFADDTTIFLRDVNCLAKIELILELSQKASSSKINFSKSTLYKNN